MTHDRRFSRLSKSPCDQPTEALDVDGDRVVFVEDYCVGLDMRSRLQIDELTDSAPPRTLVENWHGWAPVRVAGKFVAWSDRKRVLVYDVDAKQLSYTAVLPRYMANGVDLDVQADGKVVAGWGDDGENVRLAWFSLEEPKGHAIPLHASKDEDEHTVVLRFADNHVAFERKISDGKTELVVADLDGKVEHIASFDRMRSPRIRDFDFNGKQLTWASRGKAESKRDGVATIYLAHLG